MDREVYLWGDSIGKGVIYHEERHRYCLAKRRCTVILEENGVNLDSHAQMGATIYAGYADFCQTETERGAVAVIEFGGNDCDLDWEAVAAHPETFHDGKVPLEEFRALLDTFIRDARVRGLSPLLVTPPPLCAERYFAWVTRGRDAASVERYLVDVAHIYRWQERYAQAVREASWRNRCPMLDLRGTFLEERDFPSLMCLDGIHPNEAGQELMARAILSCLPEYAQMLSA